MHKIIMLTAYLLILKHENKNLHYIRKLTKEQIFNKALKKLKWLLCINVAKNNQNIYIRGRI